MQELQDIMTTHKAEPNTVPSNTGDGVGEASPMLSNPHLPVTGIEEPSDSDVLCGRGGAALRHPGNQTYRRLVHLNKGLYITCLKAEKLKISRSIVCAIREQNGRFLEKNAEKGTWYDIGDKKAVEKTSQALREGQPKLRQKIVELGGGAAGAAALLESQFPGAQGAFTGSNPNFHHGRGSSASFESQQAAAAAAVVAASQPSAYPSQHMSASQPVACMPPADGSFHGMSGMGHGHNMPPRRPAWDISSPEYMQRLSLDDDEQQMLLHTSFNNSRGDLQIGGGDLGDSQQTLLHANTFMDSPTASNPNNAASRINSQLGDAASPRPFPPQDSDSESETLPAKVDRRGVFAKMKYERPASGKFSGSGRIQTSGRSLGDALSYSEVGSFMSSMSLEQPSKDNHSKVPSVAEVFGGGSRRSVMSGLSKISDADNSIISDLSRKIGNVSTRSILSEISGMDEESMDVTIDTRDFAAHMTTNDGVNSGERSPQDG